MLGNLNTEINMFVSFVFWFLLCLSSNVESYEYSRIIGGEPAVIADFPYQLAMERIVNGTYHFYCGASIIRRSWAITAAHCVAKHDKSQMRLRSGSSCQMMGGRLHYIEKIIVHPRYSKNILTRTTDYDVAIIKVCNPFDYSERTENILMAFESPSTGTEAVVSGWGDVNVENESPIELQKLTVNIIEYEECKISHLFFLFALTPRYLCAGAPEVGKTIFQGDSGGPLVVNGTLVGIVTFFKHPDLPAVYIDVAKLRTWVTESIEQESIHN